MKLEVQKGLFIISALILTGPSTTHAAVLANVGGKAIDSEQIKSEYETINDEQRRAVNKDLIARRTVVDSAINTEVLYQAAKKSGLEKDNEFQKALERFKRQYLATKILEKSIESKLSSGSVKKYFEAHKGLFDSTQVCASHIVVSEEEQARKLASVAKSDNAKFDDLAKKNSIDPTVQDNKGDLGCFTRERMVPQFSDAAFSMKKNEIRGPVMTSYGYHVIKVYDIKPGKVPNYEEVEQRVKDAYRLKLMQEMIADLRTKSEVKVNEEELKKFRL